MNPVSRRAFFERLREANPHPTTELVYSTPFELLVAVMLSAQATDVSVNKATRGLFQLANTPSAMLRLGEERVREAIRTIGLFNTKARNIIRACAIIESEHGGEIPRQRHALEALPGVGRKTANVVLNTAFGEPTIAVDTHIFRVANRTGLDTAGGRAAAAESRANGISPGRASLADPARTLCLHGTQTALRGLCRRRIL